MKKGLKIWTRGDQSFSAFHCLVDPTGATVTGLRLRGYGRHSTLKKAETFLIKREFSPASQVQLTQNKLFQVISLPKIFYQPGKSTSHVTTLVPPAGIAGALTARYLHISGHLK